MFKTLALGLITIASLNGNLWAEPQPTPPPPITEVKNLVTTMNMLSRISKEKKAAAQLETFWAKTTKVDRVEFKAFGFDTVYTLTGKGSANVITILKMTETAVTGGAEYAAAYSEGSFMPGPRAIPPSNVETIRLVDIVRQVATSKWKKDLADLFARTENIEKVEHKYFGSPKTEYVIEGFDKDRHGATLYITTDALGKTVTDVRLSLTN